MNNKGSNLIYGIWIDRERRDELMHFAHLFVAVFLDVSELAAWADSDLMDTGNLTPKAPRHEQGTGPEAGVQTTRRGLQTTRA